MSAHTRGPWKLIWHGNETYPFPLTILTADDEKWKARDGTVSSDANAHLIAAAPEMLEACEAMLAVSDSPEPIVAQVIAVSKARAAISKAGGES